MERLSPKSARPVLALLAATVALLSGCSANDAAEERRVIREQHLPDAISWIREDLARASVGVRTAGEQYASVFVLEDAETRERRLRQALHGARRPPRAIPEFVPSPITFLVGVGTDGTVIARDAEPDSLRGQDFGERYPVVAAALATGARGRGLAEFVAEEGDARSVSVLFAAPARHEGRTVGVVAAAMPLWSIAQRVTRQLRGNHAADIERGVAIWAYVYEGEHIHHRGTPPDLDLLVPDHATRTAALAEKPNGYTGMITLFGRNYGYGVVPMPQLGEDIGLVIFRSEP
jgi:hypothetical protein